jgi:hypothetical protein
MPEAWAIMRQIRVRWRAAHESVDFPVRRANHRDSARSSRRVEHVNPSMTASLRTAGICAQPRWQVPARQQRTQLPAYRASVDNSANAVAARACLAQAGIDVDWAGNGVCLPTNDNAPTKAFRHWDLHGPAYNAQMRFLCEQAFQNGGSQAVKDMLDQVRTSLSEGTKFW